ncbi:MAG: alkaline phosphatase family protein, partial [Terriglobales bacterium]
TDGSGPSWVSSIINAVGYSPCTDLVNGQPLTYWQDTVILVTWDDWGGWYDHVHPPPLPAAAPAIASSYAYGFRVPLLVVSAYTPAGTVDNNTAGLDFGTILKFIEEVFNLSNINSGDLGSFADQWSNGDLSDFFQFSQPPKRRTYLLPSVPAQIPLVRFHSLLLQAIAHNSSKHGLNVSK